MLTPTITENGMIFDAYQFSVFSLNGMLQALDLKSHMLCFHYREVSILLCNRIQIGLMYYLVSVFGVNDQFDT